MLCTFGLPCFYYDLSPKSKLKPRSCRGIFVGYDTFSFAYRVYDPKKNKVLKVRDVKVDESINDLALPKLFVDKKALKANLDKLLPGSQPVTFKLPPPSKYTYFHPLIF